MGKKRDVDLLEAIIDLYYHETIRLQLHSIVNSCVEHTNSPECLLVFLP